MENSMFLHEWESKSYCAVKYWSIFKTVEDYYYNQVIIWEYKIKNTKALQTGHKTVTETYKC